MQSVPRNSAISSFLRSPITKMHKAMAKQNVEIEAVYGGYGSPKVIGNITTR